MNGANTTGPPSVFQNHSSGVPVPSAAQPAPMPRWRRYQSARPSGSRARKNNPPIPCTGIVLLLKRGQGRSPGLHRWNHGRALVVASHAPRPQERAMAESLMLKMALIGLLGVGAQWVAWRTGKPAIVLMLIAGIIAGPVLGRSEKHTSELQYLMRISYAVFCL